MYGGGRRASDGSYGKEKKKAEGNDVHDVTRIPEGVVERTELGAVDGVRDLGDQHGRSVG